MLQLPAATADTSPVEELTVATAVLLLLHTPVPPPKTTELAEYIAIPLLQSGVAPLTEAMLAFGLIVTDCWAVLVPLHPPVIV
jgi:hypothetical protein